MPINVLPTHLVNKIAAGEVIERPASVVKELVENALDAGATRIDVTIEAGGQKLIAVADDGGGMGPDDLALAFAPHATSKISQEDDLFRIATMGFRGEALASIASVSHAHIRTRRRDEPGGHEIEASGESLGSVRPCAAAGGTTVTIRDLFFNTPARRKFMRTVNTETGHISEQIARLALPHPQVAFTLTHNGRSVLKLPSVATTLQRVADLFGPEAAAVQMPIRQRGGTPSVAGLIGQPSAARATAQWQYFFLNGRYIRDRLLAHALKEAYRGMIEPSRFPAAFVFITIDPSDVDVNVHPTKIEVRFRDSQAIHSLLLAALRDTLHGANLAPDVFSKSPGAPASPAPHDSAAETSPGDSAHGATPTVPNGQAAIDAQTPAQAQDARETTADERRASLRQALADFFKSSGRPQPRLSFPPEPPPGAPRAVESSVSDYDLATGQGPQTQLPIAHCLLPIEQQRQEPDTSASMSGDTSTSHAGATQTTFSPTVSRAIQIHNTYIVASTDDGLVIIDQHALHERLMYNDLAHRLQAGPLAGQRMLLPVTLTVTPTGAAALASRGDLLARLGIEVAPFGPTAVAIQQFPSLLAQRGVEPAAFLQEIVDKLSEFDAADAEQVLEELLQMLACKAAVKAGDPLTPAEIEALLARHADAEKGSSCPHGRPTVLKMTLKDLEKQFKRI